MVGRDQVAGAEGVVMFVVRRRNGRVWQSGRVAAKPGIGSARHAGAAATSRRIRQRHLALFMLAYHSTCLWPVISS